MLAAGLLATPASAQDEPASGERVFTEVAEPPCATCHTLAAVGANGQIGPNLDDLKPTEERVRAAVSGGVGIMPAYRGALSEAEIEAVAVFVAKAAGSGG